MESFARAMASEYKGKAPNPNISASAHVKMKLLAKNSAAQEVRPTTQTIIMARLRPNLSEIVPQTSCAKKPPAIADPINAPTEPTPSPALSTKTLAIEKKPLIKMPAQTTVANASGGTIEICGIQMRMRAGTLGGLKRIKFTGSSARMMKNALSTKTFIVPKFSAKIATPIANAP